MQERVSHACVHPPLGGGRGGRERAGESSRGKEDEALYMYMYKICYCTCIYMYSTCSCSDIEGWLSPGGHSSGGRALTAEVRGPRFNPGWLPVFRSSLKIFLTLFIMYMYTCTLSVYHSACVVSKKAMHSTYGGLDICQCFLTLPLSP